MRVKFLLVAVACGLSINCAAGGQVGSTTERLERELRSIPVSEYKKNLVRYKKLLRMHPENKRYQNKVAFYADKIVNCGGCDREVDPILAAWNDEDALEDLVNQWGMREMSSAKLKNICKRIGRARLNKYRWAVNSFTREDIVSRSQCHREDSCSRCVMVPARCYQDVRCSIVPTKQVQRSLSGPSVSLLPVNRFTMGYICYGQHRI